RTGPVKGIAGFVRFVRVEPTEALPPPPLPPQRSRLRRRLLVLAAVGLVALVAGLAIVLGHRSNGVVIRPFSVVAIDPDSGRVLRDAARVVGVHGAPVGPLPPPLV